MVDNKILGGAGGFIQVTYFIFVTYCHLACLKRHSIVCEWLLNLLRWLQVVPCSHNYELFAVNDNSKTKFRTSPERKFGEISLDLSKFRSTYRKFRMSPKRKFDEISPKFR